MNELRWILLIAGLLLIVAIYAWGARARRRTATGSREAETRPPVFTGGATGFERAPTADDAAAEDEEEMERRLNVPAAARRIEPSLTLDEPRDDAGRYAPDRGRERVPAAMGTARREPTLNLRDEPLPTPRTAAAAPAVRPEARPPEPERTPVTGARPEAPQPQTPMSTGTVEPAPRAAKPSRAMQKIVAVRVTAAAGASFEGAALMDALYGAGLQFGRYDIFHRMHDGQPVISAASLREPGSFDVNAMPTTTYPGVALFAVLPGPAPAADVFDELLYIARSLASQLGGALADERGAPLTAHRVMRMREEALEFGHAAGPA